MRFTGDFPTTSTREKSIEKVPSLSLSGVLCLLFDTGTDKTLARLISIEG